ncbi:MAG: tetratricopeptide repeat protein, partial [Myxococcales bacterium]|nr:tetratricopeptide repeat protein [Myxococcales bacterium]
LLGRIALDRFAALLQQLEREQPEGAERAELVARIDRERKAAQQAFTRAAALDPSRAHPYVALSQVAWLDGRRDEARAHLLRALAIDPDVRADHGQLTDGMTPAQRIELYRDLRKRYEGTTNARPEKVATLWFFEGRAAYDAKDWQTARECFRRTETLNPAASSALYYHFFCAYQLDDHDDAEARAAEFAAVSAPAFADLLRAQPPEPRAQIAAMIQWLADRAWQQGHVEHSRDLNHVIACLKDSADAWNNHAFLCRETGRFDEAFTSYEYALQREPESPQLWNDAAVILQHHLPTPANLQKARGMYEKALELARKVLASPDSSERARQFATQAQADAQANLAELPAR